MSLFSALSTSLSGLQAVTSQLQLVANNIANAGQAGYTRKNATTSPISLGGVGGGTQITGFTRAENTALTKTLYATTANAGLRNAQDDYSQQVQTLLGANSGENPPLSDAISQFSSAWTELAAAPESQVQQQQVIQAAKNLVAQVSSVAGGVEELDRQVYSDINTTVSELNSNLINIKDLNAKISQATSSNQPPGDLQDQRDQLVLKVASLIDIKVLPRDQGQIALYTPTGYALLDGEEQSFSYDGTKISADSAPTQSLNDVLVNGKLQALVNFRRDDSPSSVSTDSGTEVIRKLRSQLDTIVSAFTTSSAGPPETFAYAYANATGTGTEATSIFSGTTRNDFVVNSTLLNGSRTVKVSSPQSVTATFNDSSKSFSADGLTLTNASYNTLATSIVSGFQQSASTISQLATTAEGQRSFLEQRLASETGVNTDTELVNLTTLQNSYAASARVMAVIQEMFRNLEAIT